MNVKFFALPVLIAGLSVGAVFAAETPHWTYSGHAGPAHWAELSPAFATCGAGRNQSPVDLTNMIEGELAPITFSYQAGGNEVVNNGHTIQVNYRPGSTISLDGHRFELKQFHFHAPSENTINGESFPMEAHFVHADKDGNLAVVALMFKEGNENSELAKAWSKMPRHAGDKAMLSSVADANSLLPADRDYYRFNGSLTTPPCSEGVYWLVMKQPVSASEKQLEQFAHVMHHANNRPVQPLNARMVVK